jgi:YafQ family addiction module toxin component
MLDIEPNVYKTFKKLEKKNPNQIAIIEKKIQQILNNPYHFKPLRGDMHGARRVHIDKSFVLVYEIKEKDKAVVLLEYEHHDKIY